MLAFPLFLSLAGLLRRYVDFCIAPSCGRVYCFHDALNMRAKLRPLLQAENRDRDFTACNNACSCQS